MRSPFRQYKKEYDFRGHLQPRRYNSKGNFASPFSDFIEVAVFGFVVGTLLGAIGILIWKVLS